MWPRRSHMLSPLTTLTHIKRKFKWTKVEQDDFNKIRRIEPCSICVRELPKWEVTWRTPNNALLCEAHSPTARPHRRPAEGDSEKIPPCRDYKRLRPSVPHHLITSVLHHLIGWFGRNRDFSTRRLRRPSMGIRLTT